MTPEQLNLVTALAHLATVLLVFWQARRPQTTTAAAPVVPPAERGVRRRLTKQTQ